MAPVVLIGCSTSGKTSAVRRFAQLGGSEFKVIDSDAVVAADSEFKGHLYSMFLKFTRGVDNSAPQLYLELGERYLLRQMTEMDDLYVVSAGPNLPLREPEWSRFLAVVNPICFYLRVTPIQLYEGLKQRRDRQRRKGLDMCPGFGCWDNGLATEFNGRTGNWDELPPERALPLIEAHMARVEPIYLAACKNRNIYDGVLIKDNEELQKELAASILKYLHQTIRLTFPVPLQHEAQQTRQPGQFALAT